MVRLPGHSRNGGLRRRSRGKGVLIDLGQRSALHDVATGWTDRVELISARCYEHPPNLDAMLIRPDLYVAWICRSDDKTNASERTLRAALEKWFPTATPADLIGKEFGKHGARKDPFRLLSS